MSTSEKLIDKRLVDRNLRKGLINLEEYQAMLEKLPDCTDNILKELPENDEEACADNGGQLTMTGTTPVTTETQIQTSSLADTQQMAP